jgi:hypothetical protein
MKYKYIDKSFKYKNKELYFAININLYRSICIKYFHNNTLIMKDIFSEPEGTDYMKKFYIDLWFIRFEIEFHTIIMKKFKTINDGSETIAITGNDPFREKNKEK